MGEVLAKDGFAPTFKLADAEPDVWLHMAHKEMSKGMYHPIILSLGEALSGVGANVAVTNRLDDDALLRNLTRAVGKGQKPLVVVIGWHFANDETLATLAKCGESGARIVLYQAEPGPNPDRLAKAIKEFKAEEVWDFSMANLECCYPPNPEAKVRYMPPGYTTSYDLGVALDSPLRKEDKISFLGTWRLRLQDSKSRYEHNLGNSFVKTSDIWSADQLRKYVAEYPVQLNVHKGSNDYPSTARMESFRMASLLANKACLISAPVHPADQKRWEGIVHFVAPEETADALRKISGDVRGCQLEAYTAYKERFAPLRLLKESGFLEVWQPRSPSA